MGINHSMAMHTSVTTCDSCAVDHVVTFTSPPLSAFTYCKCTKTGSGESYSLTVLRLFTLQNVSHL